MDEIPVGNIPMAWVAPILNTHGYMDMDTSRVWVQMNSNVPKDIPMLLPRLHRRANYPDSLQYVGQHYIHAST